MFHAEPGGRCGLECWPALRGSTSRKHKKQETTHFNEHKKGNKSTKKEEKETRDNLKVKIGVLADKLYRTKKITKALYNKMYNVSMGAGRLNTLTTTYQN